MLDRIYDRVLAGDRKGVAEAVRQALDAGLDLDTILNRGMIAAMDEVGSRFEAGTCFVPEMIMSAHAMLAGVEILKPRLEKSGGESLGSVVLGTVKGDLHDIGKNLVGMMFQANGFQVLDLGVDVPGERFVEAARQHRSRVVGLSGLLTTAMVEMRDTVALLNRELNQDGVRDSVALMVGGAPVTLRFAREIGADLYAPDASSAVRTVKEWIRAT